MVEQNSIKDDETKKPREILIHRKNSLGENEEITLKIEKEYDGLNEDKDLVKYVESLTHDEQKKLLDSLDKNESKIFKIVLEKNHVNSLIRDMYYDKRRKMITGDEYKDCSNGAGRKIIPCVDNIISKNYNIELQNNELPYVYDILVVETRDIIYDNAQPIVAEPIVAPPDVAPPNNSTGGTRRRRNNKKNKRKTRNNRKKTNRRR